MFIRVGYLVILSLILAGCNDPRTQSASETSVDVVRAVVTPVGLSFGSVIGGAAATILGDGLKSKIRQNKRKAKYSKTSKAVISPSNQHTDISSKDLVQIALATRRALYKDFDTSEPWTGEGGASGFIETEAAGKDSQGNQCKTVTSQLFRSDGSKQTLSYKSCNGRFGWAKDS